MDFTAPRSRLPRWFLAILIPSLVASLFAPYVLLAPTSLAYELRPDVLVVEAKIGAWDQGRAIPRAGIRSAEPVRLAHGRRDAGSGLPGFCAGRWSYPDLGRVWQATDCGSRALRLDTDDGVVLVTPAEPEAFAAALRDGATGRFEGPPAPTERPAILWAVAALALLPIALTPLLLRRLARPLVYTVKDGVLVVPAMLSPVAVKLAGARVERGAMGRAWRLGGTAFPGYALGLFRKEGRNFHAAASDTRNGLWVRGDRTVYVSPADRDAFVAAVVAAGAIA